MGDMEFEVLLSIALVAFGAGAVKGAVGFAMPMLMISGLSLFLPMNIALAILILPTMLTNGVQALRQGWRAMWQTIQRFRIFLMVGFVFLVAGAQLVLTLPQTVLFLVIGVSVTLFSALLLSGVRWKIRPDSQSRVEAMIATVAGFVGGLSGVWGPPTVIYLTLLEVPKQEHIRAQGVIYGLGSVALFLAHFQTGVISKETLPLSVFALLPAVAGMWLGFRIQDRLDQKLFRKLTLIVLIVAGLNLIRRGMFG